MGLRDEIGIDRAAREQRESFAEVARKLDAEKCNQELLGAAQVGIGRAGAVLNRPTAQGAIVERIERLRREADELEALVRALPLSLPYNADAVLYQLVTGKR